MLKIMLLDILYEDVNAAIKSGDLDLAADLFVARLKPEFIAEHVAPMDAHDWAVSEFERLRELHPQAWS